MLFPKFSKGQFDSGSEPGVDPVQSRGGYLGSLVWETAFLCLRPSVPVPLLWVTQTWIKSWTTLCPGAALAVTMFRLYNSLRFPPGARVFQTFYGNPGQICFFITWIISRNVKVYIWIGLCPYVGLLLYRSLIFCCRPRLRLHSSPVLHFL